MSTTNNSIEVNSLSYTQLRTLMNTYPAKHLEEVPFGDFSLELDLVDEVYVSAEESGFTKCYCIHVDGNYAGYMLIMASEMIHHRGQMQAVTDSFYIAPEYRSSGAFKSLLQYVEQDLRDNNIRFLTVGLNPNMPHFTKMEAFMRAGLYQHTEYLVTKEL